MEKPRANDELKARFEARYPEAAALLKSGKKDTEIEKAAANCLWLGYKQGTEDADAYLASQNEQHAAFLEEQARRVEITAEVMKARGGIESVKILLEVAAALSSKAKEMRNDG